MHASVLDRSPKTREMAFRERALPLALRGLRRQGVIAKESFNSGDETIDSMINTCRDPSGSLLVWGKDTLTNILLQQKLNRLANERCRRPELSTCLGTWCVLHSRTHLTSTTPISYKCDTFVVNWNGIDQRTWTPLFPPSNSTARQAKCCKTAEHHGNPQI
jgi:hypothetical protein